MSKEKNKLFISYEQAKFICDKAQYGEATFWERIKLNIRLSWCKLTRAYTKKNRQLTEIVQKSEIKSIDEQLKEKMKQELQKKLGTKE